MKYRLNHPVQPESSPRGLYALLAVFVLSTAFFGFLAVRNAKMLTCLPQYTMVDKANNQELCVVRINPDGSIKQ